MSRGKKIALWIISGLLAALFLFAGLTKLLAPAQAKQWFTQYGYAPWFAIFIGVCETLGGIGVLVPRVAALAASGLSLIMVGAVFTLATHHQLVQAITPAVVSIFLVGVAYTRVKEARV